ncbi:MAG: outer membrane beta-barrel protein [Bacteroidetes bacterium]|nr:outer membrane beta-barrel protein [Bacteroidota bacterium]
MQANNWDDKFRDRAWNEMSKLLDEEMPLRPVPWWRRKGFMILALLLFSTILGGMMLVQWQLNDEKMALLPAGAVPAESAIVVDESKIEEVQTNTVTPVSEEDQSMGSTTVKEAIFTESESSDSAPVIPKELPAVSDPIPGSPATESFTIPQFPEAALEEKPTAFVPEEAVEKIPGLTIDPALVFSTPQAEDIVKHVPVQRWQYGISASANVGNMPAVSAGLAVRKQFGTSKWGLQSGLEVNLAHWNPNGSSSGVLLSLDQNDEQGYNMDPGTAGDTTGINVNEQFVNSVSYPQSVQYLSLHLPVTLRYRIGGKWMLHAGLRGQWVWKAYHRSPTNGDLAVYDFKGGNSLGRFEFNGVSAPELSKEYQRQQFGLSALAGIEWQLGPQLTLSGQFHVPVIDAFKADDSLFGSYGLQIGGSWFFNRPVK